MVPSHWIHLRYSFQPCFHVLLSIWGAKQHWLYMSRVFVKIPVNWTKSIFFKFPFMILKCCSLVWTVCLQSCRASHICCNCFRRRRRFPNFIDLFTAYIFICHSRESWCVLAVCKSRFSSSGMQPLFIHLFSPLTCKGVNSISRRWLSWTHVFNVTAHTDSSFVHLSFHFQLFFSNCIMWVWLTLSMHVVKGQWQCLHGQYFFDLTEIILIRDSSSSESR